MISLKTALGLLLAVSTTGEALYYSSLKPEPTADELKCSVSTVNFIVVNRRPLLFQYSSSYMAPLLETLAVPLSELTHSTPLAAIRLTGAVFLGLSTLLLFEMLALEFSLGLSAAVGIAYGLATPWLYSSKLQAPGYPAGLLCCFAFLFVLAKFQPGSFRLGVLAGVLYYIFPVSVGFVFAAFLSRFEPDKVFRSVSRLKAVLSSRRLGGLLCLSALAATVLLDALIAYRDLTGRVSGQMAGLALTASVAIGLASCSALLFMAHRIRPLDLRSGRRMVVPPLSFILGFALIEIPVRAVFRFIEMPYFSSRGVRLWSGNDYALKQWRAWPEQLSAFVDRIIPQGILPINPRAWTPLYEHATQLGATAALGIVSILAVAAGVWRLVWLNIARPGREVDADRVPVHSYLGRPGGMLLASLIVMSIVLIPSWRLFGDPSVRYLVPYFPALYLAIAVVVRDSVGWIMKLRRD